MQGRWKARLRGVIRLRLLLLAFGTAAAVVVAEGAARVLSPVERSPGRIEGLYQIDAELLYMQRPLVSVQHESPFFCQEIRTNSWGLRDTEPVLEGAARPVLVVGDSYAWGWGVAQAECFPALLETALQREVINAGVPGYSNHQELTLLRRLLPRVRPGAVVFAVTLENDAAENASTRMIDASLLEEQGGYLVNRRDGVFSAAYWKKRLRRNLRLYGLVVDTIRGLQAGRVSPVDFPLHESGHEIFDRGAGDEPEPSPALLEMTRVLQDAIRECATLQVPLVVALLPFPAMLVPERWRQACDFWGIPPARLSSTWPQDYLRRNLPPEGTVVDIATELGPGAVDLDELFLGRDGHPGPALHRRIAHHLQDPLARILENDP